MKRLPIALVLAFAIVGLSLRADAPPPANVSQPIEKWIDELKLVAELVKQLDDPKFDQRLSASQRLERIGTPAIEPLKRVLEAKPSLETTTRISAILRAIAKEQRASNSLRKKLAEPIDLPNGLQAVTLNEALEFLGDRHGLTFIIDENAFKAIKIDKPGEMPVTLPKMKGVSLSIVVRLVLAQVQGEEAAPVGTYVIRNDYVEVTTTCLLDPINWAANRSIVPAVSIEFEREPLEQALRQLSESTGISILIDPRTGAKPQRLVSGALEQIPLDTAVRLLADMADLRSVSLERVLYVTSRENAKELEAEKEQQAAKQERSKATPEDSAK